MLISIANRKTLIRLLLKKQSDLGLHCLSRPFWHAASVQNFRTFTFQRYFDFRQPPNITCYGSSMALLRVFPVLPTLPNVSVLALFV